MIHIVNWILTRRCNLKCEYCRIIRNYENQPKEYPSIGYYVKNEMSTEVIKRSLLKIKKHNKNCFNIFYGGEPALRKDLGEIINFSNENNIHYTVISNNTPAIKKYIDNLLIETNYNILGFTSSVDPMVFSSKFINNGDIENKSINGLNRLLELESRVKDLVSEITVTNETLEYLYTLVKFLTDHGINSDITFVDIAKNNYYDFSNVTDYNLLVNKSSELRDVINRIIDEKLNVHMRDELLPIIYDSLPSNYDCKLEDNFHNMTIDADGSIRLCLRLRGVSTPSDFNVENILDNNGKLNPFISEFIYRDKKNYCELCNWPCVMMSSMISNGYKFEDLIHSEERNK